MHVLITGGTGFIGRALVAALQRRGDRVSVISRDAQRAAAVLGSATRVISEPIELVDEPLDAVVNLAGENLSAGRWNASRKAMFVSSRIETTRRLVDYLLARDDSPAVLVSASAIGWYGNRREQMLDERAAPGEGFAAELCQHWEAEALRATGGGVRVACARIGIVLAADGGALGQMLPAFKAGIGGRLGDGMQWMSWISRDDVVAVLLWLIDNSACSGIYNAVAPNPVRNRDFARTLGAVLRRPAWCPMPTGVLRLIFGEMADELLLASQRCLPHRTLGDGFAFRHAELRGALEAVLGR